MSEQPTLFEFEPDPLARSARRKRDCRVPGCHEQIRHGGGHCYCDSHECDYDTCYKLVRESGRCKAHAYCRFEGCLNMRRNVSAAKYCDDHATCVDYELTHVVPAAVTGACVVCLEPLTHYRRRFGGLRPMFLCREHRHLQPTLTKWRHTYGLSDERITEMLADPHCWICKNSLGWRFLNYGKAQAGRASIQVDHDHNCCGGSTSCGDCVRGLAHSNHNRQLGQLEAMLKDLGPGRMHELVDELAR